MKFIKFETFINYYYCYESNKMVFRFCMGTNARPQNQIGDITVATVGIQFDVNLHIY